jgi:thiamine-phosphate pyrophosphorylase
MKPLDFHLILITDRIACKPNKLEDVIKSACQNGVKAVQLREKNLDSHSLLKFAKKLRKITKHYSAKLIINDRLDIALLSKADGLHSPVNGLTAEQIRNHHKKLVTGKSVHSLEEAVRAERLGFDYIIFGPVFRTPSKTAYGKPKGLKELKKVCMNVNIPVFAVGGINPVRAGKCIKQGAYGVAVIRNIMCSKKIKQTLKQFKQEKVEL